MSGGEVLEIAAETWAFRYRVEREAEARFRSMAQRLLALGSPEPVRELAARAAADERRHAGLCAELARSYGCEEMDDGPVTLQEIAPPALDGRQRLLYEVVAACCITETESTGVLTTLLQAGPRPEVRRVLHALARDEVAHARLGWAHLASERALLDVGFLAECVPQMLSGTIDPALFEPGDGALEAPELLEHGVLPRSQKREVFVQTLREVVLPGLEALGVDGGPGRRWLSERLEAPGTKRAPRAFP